MADTKEPRKETVRITLPPRPAPITNQNAPGRDTVRINLPVRPPAAQTNGPRLPPTAPTRALPPVAQTPFVSGAGQTGDAAAAIRRAAARSCSDRAIKTAVAPGNFGCGQLESGRRRRRRNANDRFVAPSSRAEKRNRAHYGLARPAVKTAGLGADEKTQPLITMPDRNIATAPIKLAPAISPVAVEDGIPMSLCWSVLGISAIILLIQIWNYVA